MRPNLSATLAFVSAKLDTLRFSGLDQNPHGIRDLIGSCALEAERMEKAEGSEQDQKAALFFDHIQKAREHGKMWWAEALTKMLDESIERDRLIEDLLSAIRIAVERVRLANSEGNPILSAWLADAEATLSKAEGR